MPTMKKSQRGKRTYRSSKKKYAPIPKGIPPNNGQVGYFRLRGQLNVTSDSSGNIINGFRLTQPDSFDGAGSVLTDWVSVGNLYDQFRVCAIKLTYIPTHPNDSTATAAYRPLYVFADYDAVGLSPTDALAVGYGNMKVKNAYRPWTYYIKVPKLVNTGSSSVNIEGFMDTVSPQVTGSLYISKAGGFSNSTTYGVAILTYYIQAVVRK